MSAPASNPRPRVNGSEGVLAAEAYRRAEQVAEQLKEHQRECGERWRTANGKLNNITEKMAADDAVRAERQRVTDKQHRRLTTLIAVLGLILTAATVLTPMFLG